MKNSISNKHIFYALILLIFVAPFLRGLFFDLEFLIIHILTSVIFLYLLIAQKDREISIKILDFPTIAFLISYTIALFVALNLRNAVGEVFRYLNYFLLYILVRSVCCDHVKKTRLLLNTIYISGIIESIIGLAAALGTVKIEGAYISGRIASTLGYSNALGGFLIPILVIGIYLSVIDNKKSLRLTYDIGNYLICLTILGTVSRGAYLLLPIGLFLYMFFVPKKYKITILKGFVVPLFIVLLIGPKILSTDANYGQILRWSMFLGGALLSAGISFVSESEAFKLVKEKRVFIIATISVIVGVSGLLIYVKWSGSSAQPTTAPWVPTNISQRIITFGLQDSSVRERAVIYQDAIKVIKDYPLLGIGGGGWAAIYNKYQSYAYFTTKTHNQLLQVWVEAGLPGLLSYLFLWGTPIILFFRLRKFQVNPEQHLMNVTLFLSIVIILLHSLIDFNLSLGASFIILLSLLAMLKNSNDLSSEGLNKGKSFQINRGGFKTFSLVISCVFALVSASFLIGFIYSQAGAKNIKDWDLVKANKNMKMAHLLDPINALYVADLAQILHYTGDPVDDMEMVKEAKRYAQKAKSLAPTNVDIMMIKSKIHLSLSEFPQAIAELEEVVTMFPFDNQGYENLSDTYLKIGKYYLIKKNKLEAEKYLREVTKIPTRINERLSKVKPEHKALWSVTEMLAATPKVKSNAEAAAVLLQ